MVDELVEAFLSALVAFRSQKNKVSAFDFTKPDIAMFCSNVREISMKFSRRISSIQAAGAILTNCPADC